MPLPKTSYIPLSAPAPSPTTPPDLPDTPPTPVPSSTIYNAARLSTATSVDLPVDAFSEARRDRPAGLLLHPVRTRWPAPEPVPVNAHPPPAAILRICAAPTCQNPRGVEAKQMLLPPQTDRQPVFGLSTPICPTVLKTPLGTAVESSTTDSTEDSRPPSAHPLEMPQNRRFRAKTTPLVHLSPCERVHKKRFKREIVPILLAPPALEPPHNRQHVFARANSVFTPSISIPRMLQSYLRTDAQLLAIEKSSTRGSTSCR